MDSGGAITTYYFLYKIFEVALRFTCLTYPRWQGACLPPSRIQSLQQRAWWLLRRVNLYEQPYSSHLGYTSFFVVQTMSFHPAQPLLSATLHNLGNQINLQLRGRILAASTAPVTKSLTVVSPSDTEHPKHRAFRNSSPSLTESQPQDHFYMGETSKMLTISF